jgi:hypothetical protein
MLLSLGSLGQGRSGLLNRLHRAVDAQHPVGSAHHFRSVSHTNPSNVQAPKALVSAFCIVGDPGYKKPWHPQWQERCQGWSLGRQAFTGDKDVDPGSASAPRSHPHSWPEALLQAAEVLRTAAGEARSE